ncbi:hypothetical protein [Helicobacter marmotae]|nr:hypothetical protein [Helicobacter marmotae]
MRIKRRISVGFLVGLKEILRSGSALPQNESLGFPCEFFTHIF